MSLNEGCYLVSFKPNLANPLSDPPSYVGTLRVGNGSKSEKRVSGDLYVFSEKAREIVTLNGWRAVGVTSKREEIPIFPLSDYAYYLDVQPVNAGMNDPVLELQAHKYDSASRRLIPGAPCQLILKSVTNSRELSGKLMSAGEERGQVYLKRVSQKKHLRRASLRIFCMQPNSGKPIRPPQSPKFKDLGQNKDWVKFFDRIGWDLSVSISDRVQDKLKASRGVEWAAYDLSNASVELRRSIDPDTTWIYDLLCISEFENDDYLGIMFDTEATDLNRRPRESAAVAALQSIIVKNRSVRAQDAFKGRLYYRAALHELGHAMNLPHNLCGKSIMNITEFLLKPSPPQKLKDGRTKPVPGFADEFDPGWEFDGKDLEWLQHAPDIAVRPGGISRHGVRWLRTGQQQVATISLFDVAQLALAIQPVENSFPLGAPMRLNYTLTNYGRPLLVPANISLPGGHISGRVTGPDRETRYFRTAFRCCDSVDHSQRLQKLGAAGSLTQGMTLLRGIDGPLFPVPGAYQIELELRWDAYGQTNRVIGLTSVTVDAVDPLTEPGHLSTAELVLNRPSMMPALVQGYLDQEGAVALSRALNSPTLRPHYLVTAVKCYSAGTGRGHDWKQFFDEATKSSRDAERAASAGDGNSVVATKPAPLRQGESMKISMIHTVREAEQLRDVSAFDSKMLTWLHDLAFISGTGSPFAAQIKRNRNRLPKAVVASSDPKATKKYARHYEQNKGRKLRRRGQPKSKPSSK